MLSANEATVQSPDDISDKSSTCHGPSDTIDFPSSSSVSSGDVESGTGSVQTKEKKIRDTIIKNEEKAVINARRLVGFATIVCAIAVSVSVYFFAKKGDKKNFELEVSFRRESTCRERRHQVHCVSTNALYVVAFLSMKGLWETSWLWCVGKYDTTLH
jgi:hypothetical protein